MKQKKKIPQAIFLDWNGTLSPSKFWGHLEFSNDQEKRDKFNVWVSSLFGNCKDLIDPWMRGKYTSEEFTNLIAKDTGHNKDEILREFIIGCEKMELATPKISKLLKKIKNKGIRTVIGTNNMDSFTRWTVPAMKLNDLFDDILNSYDLKAMKHDLDAQGKSLFFSRFFANNPNIKTTECIFFDDGRDKEGVIAALGLTYIQVSSENPLEKELQELALDD